MDYKDWESESPEGILPQDYFAYVSKKQGYDPDSPNFTQAMRSEQVDGWIKACAAELQELAQRGTWTEMHKKDLPPNANILPGTWAFKVKQYPDGRFRKCKARYCVRGEQVGEWIKACAAELLELAQRGTWTEMHKKDLSPNANIVPGTWAFKVK